MIIMAKLRDIVLVSEPFVVPYNIAVNLCYEYQYHSVKKYPYFEHQNHSV